MHQSIATIDSPEFINLQPLDINPLMSSCEIKVLYVGKNRNKSSISKEVASEMAKSLRGAPIVGYFKKDKGDFRDHGEKVIIDEGELKFECQTIPYGFVAPDAKVWFQKFEDFDDFGNSTIREYLMTIGYLWTGQFEEAKLAINEGRPHSMELDKDTLEGDWSQDYNSDMEFFIINDAIFSKLCILGDDVEPCFEGSSVTSPTISKNFNKIDDEFTTTLFTMMNDLKSIYKEGGQTVSMNEQEILETQDISVETAFNENEEHIEAETSNVETEVVEYKETPSDEKAKEEEQKAEEDEEKKDESNFAAKEEEEEKKEDSKSEPEAKDDEEKKEEEYACGGDSEKKKDYSLLEAEYEELKNQYSLLKAENDELLTFKQNVEREEKKNLIAQFYMLDDEDKKEYLTNIDKYSLDDIEKELSVICRRKKVNFTEEVEVTTPVETVTTYSFNDVDDSTPAWIAAVKKIRDSKNI